MAARSEGRVAVGFARPTAHRTNARPSARPPSPSAAVEDVCVVDARAVSETHRVRDRFQPSVFIRAVCSVPLLLLVAVLVWGGATTGGLAGWLAWVGAFVVLVVIGRGWIIRVEDLGDRMRVVNWMRTVEVSWSEVDRFEFDGGVAVRRADLTTLPLSAFPAVSRDMFGIAERRNGAAFRALEATRERRRQQARNRGRA